MTKVSSARSDARHFVLGESVKMAQSVFTPTKQQQSDWRERLMKWMDPAHAGGLTLSIGGGLTLADAMRGNKSFARRLGQLALGAGIGYAGYQSLTNPAWQRNINDYTSQFYSQAKNTVSPFIARLRALLSEK